MRDPLDEMPAYLEDEVRNRIGAGAIGSTLLGDDDNEELIVAYTGFTDALRREYETACEERDEAAIKVYQLTTVDGAIQLTRYQSATGQHVEQIWHE